MGSAVLQFDGHLFGLKRLKVAISNPPKKRGDGEFSNRAAGQGDQFRDGSSQMRKGGPARDVVDFVRPTFIPSRLKTQEQSEYVECTCTCTCTSLPFYMYTCTCTMYMHIHEKSCVMVGPDNPAIPGQRLFRAC